MVDRETPSESQQKEQTAESGWKIAFKAIFWFLVVPAGVVLLVSGSYREAVPGDPSWSN